MEAARGAPSRRGSARGSRGTAAGRLGWRGRRGGWRAQRRGSAPGPPGGSGWGAGCRHRRDIKARGARSLLAAAAAEAKPLAVKGALVCRTSSSPGDLKASSSVRSQKCDGAGNKQTSPPAPASDEPRSSPRQASPGAQVEEGEGAAARREVMSDGGAPSPSRDRGLGRPPLPAAGEGGWHPGRGQSDSRAAEREQPAPALLLRLISSQSVQEKERDDDARGGLAAACLQCSVPVSVQTHRLCQINAVTYSLQDLTSSSLSGFCSGGRQLGLLHRKAAPISVIKSPANQIQKDNSVTLNKNET